jgi:hypothetical protein
MAIHDHIFPGGNAYTLIMSAVKRIPVAEPVWKDRAGMRHAGQTYTDLLSEMIEERKKHILHGLCSVLRKKIRLSPCRRSARINVHQSIRLYIMENPFFREIPQILRQIKKQRY